MKKINYPNEKKQNNKQVAAVLHFLQAGVLYLQSLLLLGLSCLAFLAVSRFLMDHSEVKGAAKLQQFMLVLRKMKHTAPRTERHIDTRWTWQNRF